MSKVRATRAYLAGFGTAGSLLAGAALLFLLATAYVSFRGWPKVGDAPAPASVIVTPASESQGAQTAGRLALIAARAGGVLPGLTIAPAGPGGLARRGGAAGGRGPVLGGSVGQPSSSSSSSGVGQTVGSSGPGTPAGCSGPQCVVSPPAPPGGPTGPAQNIVQQTEQTVTGTANAVGSSAQGAVGKVTKGVGGAGSPASGATTGAGSAGGTVGNTVHGTTGTAGGVVTGATGTASGGLGGLGH